jgi:hypothetical protein
MACGSVRAGFAWLLGFALLFALLAFSDGGDCLTMPKTMRCSRLTGF